MRATSLIPIVFAVANDPVGTGFVKSLARPGGNVTGMSLQQHDIAGKRIELFREVCAVLRLTTRECIFREVVRVREVIDAREERSRPHLAVR